jgi:undecaprenyl-diphosphatase
MAQVWSFLRDADISLFLRINGEWTHPWLDAFFPWLTDINQSRVAVWGALPVALAWWFYAGRGKAVRVFLAMALAVALCDALSHRFIKPLVHRARPEKAGVSVVLRTRSHGGYSFPSNHAANSFSGATVLGLAYPAWRIPALLIAALVAYSRVYVGVHFPSDVAAGAALGMLIGGLIGSALRWGGKTRARKKR